MKILITGAEGFVGRNLTAQLENIKKTKEKYILTEEQDGPDLLLCTRRTGREELEDFCRQADLVIHLAGVNRSSREEDFLDGNAGFTAELLELLKKANKDKTPVPVIYASSIHADRNDIYGKSKRAAELLIQEYGQETGARTVIYRFTNLFGKWCRPDYNSVTATFCFRIARGLPVEILNGDAVLTLTYIDDAVEEILRAASGNEHTEKGFGYVPETYQCSVRHLSEILQGFSELRNTLEIPRLDDPFIKKLYATYLTYLPVEAFRYPLAMHEDQRGSFTEMIRTEDRGQISVSISGPGIVRGNHWHHTKHEKFLVVSGHGLLQLRRLGRDEAGNPFPVREFEVSGEKMEIVEMIPGYTHNLINLSRTENLVTVIWASECFDPERPDTYPETV
ncbi:MAG: NAD-dependent epimerase/dehydratase family protein [Emergencia sp.]